MGDDYPEAWIEVKLQNDERDFGWRLLGKLPLFSLTQEKAFLLKSGKKSYEEHWNPLKPLRGLPGDISDGLKYRLKDKMRERDLDKMYSVSWYRLSELQNIDFDTVLSTREGLSYEDYKGRMDEILDFLEQFTSEEFNWPSDNLGRDIQVDSEDIRIVLWVRPESGKGHTTLEKEVKEQDWYEEEDKPYQDIIRKLEKLDKDVNAVKSLLKRPEASEKFREFLKEGSEKE